MATSGTIGATVYRVADLLESISRRCGVEPAKLTPEGIDVITGSMWRLLAAWSNRGVNLWRLYHELVPFYSGQQVYPLTQGDIDIMRAIYRTPIRLSAETVTSSAGGTVDNLSDGDLETVCTQSSADGNIVWDWGSDTTEQVALVGINSLPARSYDLTFEISNDGSTWTTVLAPGAVSYAAHGWKWYEIEPAGIPSRYFRISEGGGAIISFEEVVLASNWTDVDITRWNLDQWSTNPNKRSVNNPRQYYLERLLTPQMNLWPCPGPFDQLNLMCLWKHRHIEDVGVLSNTLDIPERWYQPLVDMCAYVCLPEVPGADLQRYEMLKDISMGITLPDAEKEERDKAPIQLTYGIGVYTR